MPAFDADRAVLSVEGVSRVYEPMGPQRITRFFSRLGGVSPDDFFFGPDDDDDDEELIDDEFEEEVSREPGVAIDDVSFEAEAGTCVSLMGPERAGKSVLLKVIAGALSPTKGRVVTRGRVAPALDDAIAVMPKMTSLRSALPVVAGILHVAPRDVRSRVDEILDFADASDSAGTRAGYVPTKRRREVLLATMLLVQAEIIVIDTALPRGPLAEKYREKILGRRAEGALVLMGSQNLKAVWELPDRVLHMRQGRIVGDEPYEAARQAELVRVGKATES
jgi:ABC-type polysaccharide/polyol phosphate transport system ATPase subunit